MDTLTRKLSSRKLWIAVIGIIVGLATTFGLEESEWAPVVGVVGSIASCIAYILGEAKIDAARESEKDIYYDVTTETVTGDTSLIGTDDPSMSDDGK